MTEHDHEILPAARPRPRPRRDDTSNQPAPRPPETVNGTETGVAVTRPAPALTADQPAANGDGRLADIAKLNPGVVGFGGLAKIGSALAWKAVGWATKGSVESTRQLLREVSSGEPIVDIVDSRVEAVRGAAWRALGLGDSEKVRETTERNGNVRSSYRDLRTQGDRLLEMSTDPLSQPKNEHPAFARILEELAPDEARILRFMALAGPQPALDVRSKTPFNVGSERLAGGINLIAQMAGCTYPERNQQYLANLNRLGMVRFSEEQVEDPRRYSFIEAQPVVSDAMAKAKKARTVYRSIYLSLFGHQFCDVCFTMDGYDAGGWIRDVR